VRSSRPPGHASRYWPVLLLDVSAIAVLVLLALTLPIGPWWWVLAALWAAVAGRRALNEHRSRQLSDHSFKHQ
jgi:hypothetical protein